MNKLESKYFKTAVKMDEAFMKILEKKDFEYITVKEICEKAQVNRSTFYLHYETIEDLLSESIQYMNNQFVSYFPIDSIDFINNISTAQLSDLYLITPQFLKPYLQYIKEHKKLFITAINKSNDFKLINSYERMFIHILSPIMDRFSIPDKEKRYVLTFYVNGIIAIVKEWMKTDCVDSIDSIVRIIEERFQMKE